MTKLSTMFFVEASYFIPAGSVPYRSAPEDRC
jgi:hypothetical protein